MEWIYLLDIQITISVKQERRGTITACTYRCPDFICYMHFSFYLFFFITVLYYTCVLVACQWPVGPFTTYFLIKIKCLHQTKSLHIIFCHCMPTICPRRIGLLYKLVKCLFLLVSFCYHILFWWIKIFNLIRRVRLAKRATEETANFHFTTTNTQKGHVT